MMFGTRSATIPIPGMMQDDSKVVVIWLVITLYNLFKPYHIDDTAHLEIARWIASHPLHPISGILNWSGIDEPIYRTNQPHLYFYLLAVWGSLFGFDEPAMHALQALFSLAAVFAFHRIAQRLAPANALWATGMLALGPAFMVDQNLMVDVPLLALWLVFFGALINGADADAEGQGRRFLIAGSACAAALLVKYCSLILLPCSGRCWSTNGGGATAGPWSYRFRRWLPGASSTISIVRSCTSWSVRWAPGRDRIHSSASLSHGS